jgi:hypothetical protein
VVVILWEHGGWGAGSAQMAAQVIEAYVNKQRRLNHNLEETKTSGTVDVAAFWSAPQHSDGRQAVARPGAGEESAADASLSSMQDGHFNLKVASLAAHQPKTQQAQLAALTR